MTPSPDGPKYSYKAAPQFSASQMAEYVCSGTSPTRRRAIIRAARFPKTVIVAQYGHAGEGLVNFLTDSNRRLDHLTAAKARLQRREKQLGAGTWAQRDSKFSIEAIDAFERAYNRLGFSKLDCRRVHGRLPYLSDWRTRISVSLDVLVVKPVRDQRDHIGGALFLFSRGEASSRNRVERSKTVAGLIYTFCERHMKAQGQADPSLCFAVDVFGGIKHAPPRNVCPEALACSGSVR